MNNEREVLEQFFAAINRNDMHAIPMYFDPQIVRIEPEGFPTAGTYPDCYRYLFEESASRFKCVQAGRLDGFHRQGLTATAQSVLSAHFLDLADRQSKLAHPSDSGHELVSRMTANNDNNILTNDKSYVTV